MFKVLFSVHGISQNPVEIRTKQLPTTSPYRYRYASVPECFNARVSGNGNNKMSV